jgi:hypothetical protein
MRVIDRNIHNTDPLVRQSLLRHPLQVLGLLDPEASGAEGLGKLDKVDTTELDARRAAILGLLLKRNHVERAVVPDEVRDVALLLYRCRELLRGEHESAVAGHADDFLSLGGVIGRLDEGRGDCPRESYK